MVSINWKAFISKLCPHLKLISLALCYRVVDHANDSLYLGSKRSNTQDNAR